MSKWSLTNQEMIETIKSNYPPSNYTMLRESLDKSIELLTAQNKDNIKLKKIRKIIKHADEIGLSLIYYQDIKIIVEKDD